MKSMKSVFRSKKKILVCAGIILAAGCAVSFLSPMAQSVFEVHTAAAERKLPIYCVDTPEPRVSISFDAAWGADDTDTLLQILKDNDVKTTFFMCGYWVDDFPEEVKKIAADGHDLGNHSATHPHMSQLSKEQIKAELTAAHEKVKALTGVDMDLFRPPFGEYDNKVIEAAQETGYHTVQWDVEAFDAKSSEKRPWGSAPTPASL